jgi:hypothetical protein
MRFVFSGLRASPKRIIAEIVSDPLKCAPITYGDSAARRWTSGPVASRRPPRPVALRAAETVCRHESDRAEDRLRDTQSNPIVRAPHERTIRMRHQRHPGSITGLLAEQRTASLRKAIASSVLPSRSSAQPAKKCPQWNDGSMRSTRSDCVSASAKSLAM